MSRHIKIAAAWIGALATLLTTAAPQAQDSSSGQPLYDVELVIFRVLAPTGSPEQWAVEENLAKAGVASESEGEETASAATERAAAQAAINWLPPEQFKLTAIEDTLKRSRDYQPVAHLGWTQAGYALNSNAFVSLSENLAGGPVSGRASLSRGRYLHLTLDLLYQQSEGQRYVIRQSRRMRSNERHYFDHPYFGVIAQVTPHTGS